jgi:hypothetical protein
VIWFGLLVGVASPAFACGTSAKGGDCCPEGSHSPCPDEKGPDFASLTACCVNAPPAPSAVSVEATRNTSDQPHDSGSPDPIVVIAWFSTLFPQVRAQQAILPATSSPRTDAALIWLRTGRLRL